MDGSQERKKTPEYESHFRIFVGIETSSLNNPYSMPWGLGDVVLEKQFRLSAEHGEKTLNGRLGGMVYSQ